MRHRKGEWTEVAPCRSWRRPVAWVVLVTLMLNPLLVLGQNSGDGNKTLRPGDRIEMTVPGRPDLNADLFLDADGRVDIAEVGEVALGGMTLPEANLFIKQKIRLFHPNIDTLHLAVVQGVAAKIYVIGQVSRPGTQSFDRVPTILDVLLSAGGPLDSADLRSARVIRNDEGLSRVHPLDLSGILDGKSIPQFEFRQGDTLVIPAKLQGTSGVPSSDGVKVFGGVAVSSIVPIDEPMPMLDVIMLAGAPAAEANLEKVWWIHNDGGKAVSTLVNLELYLKEGNAIGNPSIYPGDTLQIELSKPGWFRANVPWVLGTVAAVVTILLGYDRLINGDN